MYNTSELVLCLLTAEPLLTFLKISVVRFCLYVASIFCATHNYVASQNTTNQQEVQFTSPVYITNWWLSSVMLGICTKYGDVCEP